jgi:flagellar assembly protein FliH
MTIERIKNTESGWRPYRFPPRIVNAQQGHDTDPAAIRKAVAEGFQEGTEKGYQQGLLQGQEDGEQQGFEKGHVEGLQRGLEEGREQGRQAFEAASQPLDSISEQLRDFLNEFEIKRRQELQELVKKVARQVIRCELTLQPTQLLSLVEEALEAMPEQQDHIRVLLNPEECARIRDLAPERADSWRLVPDDTLTLGECRVVTDQTEADIGCQQRLDSCMDTLSEHLQLTED